MIKLCCQDLTNRTVTRLASDLTVSVCSVCGCRHFELTVEPGKVGVKGEKL